MKQYNKVLVLGSGALKIGEAGEFDYSGSQAIKALKEEGIKSVLVNPNIATIQTSDFLADEVYFLPVNPYFVEKVIEKEKPDAIFLSFGGQTALNCGIELYRKGVLKTHGVTVLGTPISSIILTEDRKKFAAHLSRLHIPIPKSSAATTLEKAQEIAQHIGFPVMIRAAFALGGQKSGVAYNQKELTAIVRTALAFSSQVLIEQYLHHYKEIEYEVVRDKYDNCVTICNMENMDPMGIHTGESIVVAPSQTLNNFEYHTLRSAAIKIVRSLGIVGECNVQFALKPYPHTGGAGGRDPDSAHDLIPKGSPKEHWRKGNLRQDPSLEYYVIEVNARLSRSSALASKATGYPLAYIAAKLSLGKSLVEIKNQVTKKTQAFFEPALDYLVVKVPRWDLAKFKGVENKIGSSMKSVGEVMAIGRTFEEAIQKAVRMLDIGLEGISEDTIFKASKSEVEKCLKIPTPKRLFALSEALKRNIPIRAISQTTGIDPWFLHRIKCIVDAEKTITKLHKKTPISKDRLLTLKQIGFSDKRIASLTNKTESEIRTRRKRLGVLPFVFQIDTLAAEFPAKTNYLYMTYCASHHDVKPLKKSGVMVLGGGAYRIGSSVEFDWTGVNAALSLRRHKKKSIIINCNPETVSTDYDISDRLYFEELTFERVSDIYKFEGASGVMISVGGQVPNNLAKPLSHMNVPIMGTKAVDIDNAEDRNKFSHLLDTLSIPQPQWDKFTSIDSALAFTQTVGYPVLIRPSYVLSGSSMNVCFNEEELKMCIQHAAIVNKEYPVTVSKFIEEAKEIEIDAVAQNGIMQTYAISEHVEHAGVHSGDATIVYPPQKIYLHTEKEIITIASKLAQKLHITGPFNIQFLAKENKVYVIEVNLRSSRTFPFLSKANGINLSQILVDAFFHKSKGLKPFYPNHVVVKASQFSFARLEGADPILRVEMSSTGEVACFGDTLEESFLKAELSVGGSIPQTGIFVSLGGEEHKVRFLDSILRLKQRNLPLYATQKTAQFLKENSVNATMLYKIHENKSPNVLNCFQNKKVDLAINITDYHFKKDVDDDYTIRRAAVDHNIHLLTNRQKAELFIKALTEYTLEDLKIKPWSEYIPKKTPQE